MSIKRVQYGRCSFIPPEGFVVQEEASLLDPHSSEDIHWVEGSREPLSITLITTATHPVVPDYSEDPLDMSQDAYPVSITLTTIAGYNNADPESYLRQTCNVLQEHLDDFRMDFCTKDRIKKSPAARSQCSFQSNFRIFLLYYAWIAGDELVNVTMTAPESGVEKGWPDLRRFVESVRL